MSGMKGEDRIYAIALLFTFILGIGSFAVLYSDVLSAKAHDPKKLDRALGLPDGYTEKLTSEDKLIGSLKLVRFIDDNTTKGFVVENTGTMPLSGFVVVVGAATYEPYAVPGVLFPSSAGAILVDEETWTEIMEASTVTITTKQDVKITLLIS